MNPAIGFTQAFDRQQCGDHAHSALSIREVARDCDDAEFGDEDFDDEDFRRFLIVSRTPTMPLGNATTINTTKPPSTSLDRSVWLTSQMLSALKTMAPTTAPETVSTPPSSTMTSASTESEMPRLSGKTLPLRYANNAPATPATVPAITNAVHWIRLPSMPMASLRKGESRVARSAKPKGENTIIRSAATASAATPIESQ